MVRSGWLQASTLAFALTFLPAVAKADDVTNLEQRLTAVQTSKAAAEPVARAREALGRARAFRNAGDELHAKLAITLAQDWTLTAEDAAKAATATDSTAQAQKDTEEAKKKIAREEAQLEEALVRGARVRASVSVREKEVVGRPHQDPAPPKSPEKAAPKGKGKADSKKTGTKGTPAPKSMDTKGEAP